MRVDTNRRSWEYANRFANRRKGKFAASISQGIPVLPREVIADVPFSAKMRVLHIMCNDGREAAYLSHKFGCRVVGVDFSPSAIEFARALNSDLRLANEFIEAEALDWLDKCRARTFDGALTTLGTLWWIADLEAYFRRVARILRAGATYCLWDFHPLVTCIDQAQKIYRPYPFQRMTLAHEAGIVDYTKDPNSFVLLARDTERLQSRYRNPSSVSDFRWSLAAIVNAAVTGGMFDLERIEEFDFLWMERYFKWLTSPDGFRFTPNRHAHSIPVAMRLVLRKAE